MKINNYDTELTELLPCPFCGGKPIAHLQGNAISKKKLITIKCQECSVQRTIGAIGNSIEWLENISIEKWNKRIS